MSDYRKDLLKRVSFFGNTKVKRNTLVFDSGLHTLHLEKDKNESDVEFVTRFLLEYLDGCCSRSGNHRKFIITSEKDSGGKKGLVTWGVK